VETGEVLVDKKFYKHDFESVIKNPTYTHYIDALLEGAYIRQTITSDEMDIDVESYEEIRTIAMELGDDIVSPEG